MWGYFFVAITVFLFSWGLPRFLHGTMSISEYLFPSILWVIFFATCAFFGALSAVLYYLIAREDVPTHIKSNSNAIRKSDTQIDSTLWLNTIIKRLFNELVSDMDFKKKLQIMIDESKSELPDFLGEIRLEEIVFGKSLPIFKSIKAQEEKEDLVIEIDLEYEDKEAKLFLSTALVLNQPVEKWATLPIRFGVENIFLKAKLRLKLRHLKELRLSLLEPPEYDLLFTNEIGGKKMLKNIPKITDVINHVLTQTIQTKYIFPNEILIPLSK